MEVEISLTLPGWSKTGRRTRGAAAARVVVDADESLPPKKRKLDGRNGKDFMSLKMMMSPSKLHTCDVCCRSFSSYQALGGHKAHHNNARRDHKTAGAGDDDAVVVCGGVHQFQCRFCYKVFSKGQALGGHRRHCQRPAVSEDGAKVLSFDLNELPPEWLGK